MLPLVNNHGRAATNDIHEGLTHYITRLPPQSPPPFRHLVHRLNDPEQFGLAVTGARLVADFLARQSVHRTIRPEDNLRELGLTSMDMVNIVLKVESVCDVTIPDREITPANFRSVAAIDSLVTSLQRVQ